MCCSVLQCVAVCYSVLQCVDERNAERVSVDSKLIEGNVLQCVAVCCSALMRDTLREVR